MDNKYTKEKSEALQLVLNIFFGPFGLFYSSNLTAAVLSILCAVTLPIYHWTFILHWPASLFLGATFVSQHNDMVRVMDGLKPNSQGVTSLEEKSILLQLVFNIFFGPFGLFYSSKVAAVVLSMFCILFLPAFGTGLLCLPLSWFVGAIIVSEHNKKVRAITDSERYIRVIAASKRHTQGVKKNSQQNS